MRLSFCLISVILVNILAGSSAIANGLCPYDEQGPLGCPEGTVWNAKIEVCLQNLSWLARRAILAKTFTHLSLRGYLIDNSCVLS